MKIQDLLVLALQILGPFPQKRMSSRSIEIVPRGGPPLKMGGPPLEFINIQYTLYSPKKRGPPLEFINQRGVPL